MPTQTQTPTPPPTPLPDTRPITAIRVIAHQDGALDNNNNESPNHWSLCLLLPNHQAVRANFKAWIPDDGFLEWKSIDHQLPRSAIAYWDYGCVAGVCVRDVYKLIVGNGRDRYVMAEDCTGCRWWVFVIIRDLEEKGYFAEEKVSEDLWPRIHVQYARTVPCKPLALSKGRFIP